MSVYSVNVPVPGRVRAIADELHPALQPFESIREEHSCLLKRLEATDDVHQLQRQVHRALEGAPAVEARVTGLRCFEEPPLGEGPVVYLAVESPGLEQLHAKLVEAFEVVEGLEGPAYVPHVTLARGGDVEAARALLDRSIEPVEWTVTDLEFWDGQYRLPISSVSLPA